MKYYILYKEENRGPLEISELEQYDLNPKSRVWAPGWTSWKDADEVPEFQAYFNKCEAETRKRHEQAQAEAQERKRKEQEEAVMAARRLAIDQNTATPTQTNVTQTTVENTSDVEENDSAVEIEWWIDINDSQVGPLKTEELIAKGLTPDTLVWHDKLTDWTFAKNIDELSPLLRTMVTQGGRTIRHHNEHTPIEGIPEGNKYLSAIISCIASLAVIVITILHAEYYDIDEQLILAGYCAGGSLLLTVISFIMAKSGTTTESINDNLTAVKKYGISIGLAIGGIISALTGSLIALNGFDLL